MLLLICLLTTAIQHTAQQKIGKGAPRVGQKAPDFTLPDTTGKPVSMSHLLAVPLVDTGKTNVKAQWLVLIFYRGYW